MPLDSSARDLLKREFPGRGRQIDQLLGLMGMPKDYTPPSILVNGNSSLGKTTVVKALLSAVLGGIEGDSESVVSGEEDGADQTPLRSSRYAFLNCVECHTPRLIFEHAIYQFQNRPQPFRPRSSRLCPQPLPPQSQQQKQHQQESADGEEKSNHDDSHHNPQDGSDAGSRKHPRPVEDGDENAAEHDADTPMTSPPHASSNRKQAKKAKQGSEAITMTLKLRERDWNKCENVNEFVEWIRRICDSTDPADVDDDEEQGQEEMKKGSKATNETRYLVLDRADRLRETAPSLLPVLMRLQQLTGRNVCVIMISTIVWEKFRSGTGGFEPMVIHFPQYSKQDTLAILERDMPLGEDQELYGRFVDLVYEVFQRNCKDLNEIRHLVALLYPLYVKPVHDGKIQKHESLKLHRHIQAYFVEAMDKLYLREISSTEWSDRALSFTPGTNSGSTPTTGSSHAAHMSASERAMLAAVDVQGHFNLPYYTKFLLFAAFLASYNPPRLDMRYFAKVSNQGGKMSRRAKKGNAKKYGDDSLGTKLRQQLIGPKTFPIERMLAIFYSILGEELAVEENVHVQTQMASLVSLRLLQRVTPMDKLDSIKCKCNVSYEMIKALAKTVSFEIDKYLFDFM
ncbi:Origin recognition complex subunit 5 [Actinomortierella ambigua]|nr:Origin recognition complex subunit 5 [Actinomortierella ambigua]